MFGNLCSTKNIEGCTNVVWFDLVWFFFRTGSSGDGWERNALLEKMVRVQRDNARKGDKIDFLEEHVAELVNELQKKNRILQMYLVREESGVLATEASDRHKVGFFFFRTDCTWINLDDIVIQHFLALRRINGSPHS